MNLSSPASPSPAPVAPLTFDLKFNPVSPLPGSGPSEMTATVAGTVVPFASFTNTQNPNYLRAGTYWAHTKSTPEFDARANSYAARLIEAAALLSSVPSDGPGEGYSANGTFELTVGGSTWRGSLLREGRGPVRDAVAALRELAGDLKRSVPGHPNSV